MVYCPQEEPCLESLLRLHSPTLEKVALGGVVDLSFPVMARIATMHNLQKLCVPLTEGLILLRGCPSLTKLTLVVHCPSAQALAEGEELLRSATTLTVVKIKIYRGKKKEDSPLTKPRNPPASASCGKCTIMALGSDMDELALVCSRVNRESPLEEDAHAVASLVNALASAGCSRVERLALGVAKEEFPASLLSALGGLGALEHLLLLEVPPGLLRAIRPAVAPRLRRLHVWWLATDECKHRGLLHNKAQMRKLKELLRRNPGLHVTVNYGACHFRSNKCLFCKSMCHKEYQDVSRLGFYAHDADAECNVCSDDSIVWHGRLHV